MVVEFIFEVANGIDRKRFLVGGIVFVQAVPLTTRTEEQHVLGRLQPHFALHFLLLQLFELSLVFVLRASDGGVD